ncbi:hypothetical protein ACX1C1_17070 [Paenibacillus sp. strain BS8-2]
MKKMLIVLCMLVLAACSSGNRQDDFTAWDEEDVYHFLEEVQLMIRELPVETDSRDSIIQKYETYFAPELSIKIFDSLYNKTDNGWRIPDGDAGYLFVVPGRGTDESDVTIERSRARIIIQEVFASGMYEDNSYTIDWIDNKATITDWKQK